MDFYCNIRTKSGLKIVEKNLIYLQFSGEYFFITFHGIVLLSKAELSQVHLYHFSSSTQRKLCSVWYMHAECMLRETVSK